MIFHVLHYPPPQAHVPTGQADDDELHKAHACRAAATPGGQKPFNPEKMPLIGLACRFAAALVYSKVAYWNDFRCLPKYHACKSARSGEFGAQASPFQMLADAFTGPPTLRKRKTLNEI